MKLTKKYKTDVAKALRCAESGKAYHWPTIAAILADEVKRLKNVLSTAEWLKVRTEVYPHFPEQIEHALNTLHEWTGIKTDENHSD